MGHHGQQHPGRQQRSWGAVAIDGYPGLGKTKAAEEFAKQFHQREIRRHGPYTRAGDERWPVCRIGMRGNTSMKDFNSALCDFYAHPGRNRGTTEQLGRQALDLVLSCETRLLIIDDLHFLHWQRYGGVEISNHFKYIANDFPLTLLSIGIGLGERGVLLEGTSYDDAVLAQTTRRTTTLDMLPYSVTPSLDAGTGANCWPLSSSAWFSGPNAKACWSTNFPTTSTSAAPATSDH